MARGESAWRARGDGVAAGLLHRHRLAQAGDGDGHVARLVAPRRDEHAVEAEDVRALALAGGLHLQLLVALVPGTGPIVGAVALEGDALPHPRRIARRGTVGRHRAL